jgi:hypothetical protein
MVATPFAVPDDVATMLNVVFTDGQVAQCGMLLAGVSAIMRSRLPLLDDWLTAGSVDPVLAHLCACEMASSRIDVTRARGLKSEQLPEHTVIFRDVDLSSVDVSEQWIDLLTPHDERDDRGRAFSILPG